MLKIPKKVSLWLSLGLSVLLFVLCIAGAFVLPTVTDLLINARSSIETIFENTFNISNGVILTLAYMIIFVVMLADVLLFLLLLRCQKGLVFTSKSIALIRGVSWCCLLLALIFCVLGLHFHLSFVVAFLAIFLGLCVRVVKNVIEEATIIKNENDLTV